MCYLNIPCVCLGMPTNLQQKTSIVGSGISSKMLFFAIYMKPLADILNKSQNTKVHITNRWGVKVLESNDYQNDWQGEYLSEGDYLFSIQIDGVVYQGNVEVWNNRRPGTN